VSAVGELVLATRNDHKVAEVTRLLAPFGLTVVPLPLAVVLPPEDGADYSDNALIKARAGARALGRAVIADDSGVEAAALGGRPGVRSARFAGEHASDAENLAKLIAEVPAGSGLRSVCALAFVDGGSERVDGGRERVDGGREHGEHVVHGYCDGTMAAAPSGAGGFGYDPIFRPDVLDGVTIAELSEAGKDAISHRGNALREFAAWYLSRGVGGATPHAGDER
jgi:XTP/dITP diphosphohydrolase